MKNIRFSSIIFNMETPLFGTCSWNYPSWLGIIYSDTKQNAAGYLVEYADHYKSAEIDSTFYRIPSPASMQSYRDAVPDDFIFTCKAPQSITLTHKRGKNENNSLFLSPGEYETFLAAMAPIIPRLGMIMLEFEYLNKNKMTDVDTFIRRLQEFLKYIPREVPLAIETRNPGYLTEHYFEFLAENGVAHVFSEKQYMPHIREVYDTFEKYLNRPCVIRLLGGDRKSIEKKTNQVWNTIVEPKDRDLESITGMIKKITKHTRKVYVNINNHYEGCAPKTILKLKKFLS